MQSSGSFLHSSSRHRHLNPDSSYYSQSSDMLAQITADFLRETKDPVLAPMTELENQFLEITGELLAKELAEKESGAKEGKATVFNREDLHRAYHGIEQLFRSQEEIHQPLHAGYGQMTETHIFPKMAFFLKV